MALLDISTIASPSGQNITGSTGTFTYNPLNSPSTAPVKNLPFIVQSDTTGVVVGKTAGDTNTVSAPVVAGSVTRVQFVSVDIAATKASTLSSATLLALPA